MRKFTLLALSILILLSGCATKSVSNSGFFPGGYYGRGGENPLYKGELSESDVIGSDSGKEITEQDITDAADGKRELLSLRKGEPLLLIQSGAMIPDQEMTGNLGKYFSVSVYSGVPEQGKTGYAKVLRLAAAKAGIDKILVYWGVMESETKDLATKSVSWIPVVGWVVPDQAQVIRIQLKVALVDVRTGQWDLFVPKVFEDTAYSASLTRDDTDQQQIAQLKSKVYQAAVESIVERYLR